MIVVVSFPRKRESTKVVGFLDSCFHRNDILTVSTGKG